MNLTNPKNVITEERLAEFYQTILPYLGGMPDILANKFSKSDLYSTDEQIIGRWTDGKPLYQKVIPFTGSSTSKNIEVISNVDTMIKLGGVIWENSGGVVVDINNYNCRLKFTKSSGQLAWQGATSYAAFTAYAIIQYTKTSDSPVSIGNDTDYSTTEKIVGTWIDGKPLYQKTINFGTLPNSGTKDVNHNIANVKHIWITGGFAENSVSGYTNQLNLPSGSGFVGWYFAVDKTKVQCATQSDRSAYSTCYVTVQYTKTTD